jgi:hypothetical protein
MLHNPLRIRLVMLQVEILDKVSFNIMLILFWVKTVIEQILAITLFTQPLLQSDSCSLTCNF